MTDIKFRNYKPSLLAAATLVISRSLQDLSKEGQPPVKPSNDYWNDKLTSLTGIHRADFEDAYINISKAIQRQIQAKDENPIKTLMINKFCF